MGPLPSKIFFDSGLDDPNQIESPEENSFIAHAIAGVLADAIRATLARIVTDLPVGIPRRANLHRGLIETILSTPAV
jgi:hypothetical protein